MARAGIVRVVVLAVVGGLAVGCSDDGKPAGTPDGGATDAAPIPDGGGAGGSDGSGGGGDAPASTQSFIILHTNDLHSHLMAFGPEADYTPATTGDDATFGGLARLAAKIKAERTAAGSTPVLLVDSGDFTMGTPFQLLAASTAAELLEMGTLGYDATTIGNHELDWGPLGLAGILKAATDRGFKVPIIASNMSFSATDPGDDELQKFQAAGLIRSKLIKEVGGLKIGFFGLLGQNAALVTPLKKPLTFAPPPAASEAAVKELRQMDKVDLVVALSHSGIDPSGMGEDRRLAQDPSILGVGGIDIVISGHTHDALPKPVQVANTVIVQAGAYGRYLGKLSVTATKTAAGTALNVDKYELISIDDTIAGDATTQASVDGYIAAVDTLLGMAGLSYKKVVAETSVDIEAKPFVETGLGDLVADAYLNAVRAVQPMAPPEIAIDASGDIRDDIKKGKAGKLWVADLFRVEPLGIGPDKRSGYPLVTFYINAHDIHSGLELSAAAKTLGSPDYFLQISGLTVEWKESAPLFQHVTGVKVGATPLILTDTTKCYKVVTNLYVASLLGLVKDLTGGIYSVVPKLEDCQTVVTDLTTRIVDANPLTPELEELKEWMALIGFVSKFPDTDNNMIPNIPASYGAAATPPRVVITP
jgi:5'-nucleotidase